MAYHDPNQQQYPQGVPPQPGHPAQYQAQPPVQQHYGQPQAQQFGQPSHGPGAWHASDSGSFNGGTYQISHRDVNAILTINLNGSSSVKSRPGAMFEMAGTVQLTANTKWKKMFTSGSMYESVYGGSGELSLAPVLLGDIATLQIDGQQPWNIGKDAYLAATADVSKKTKSQGIGKALFSGEDLFVYRVEGQGLLWVSSFGAITRREIPTGQTWVVDNGHLVAWNCDYKIEKAGGGVFTSMKTGEGAICRFTGPGTVFIQTRNYEDFAASVCKEAGVSTGGG